MSDTPRAIVERLRSVFAEINKVPAMQDARRKIAVSPYNKSLDAFIVEMDTSSRRYADERVQFNIEQQ